VFRIWEDLNNLQRVKPDVEELSIIFPNGRRLSSYGLYTLDYEVFLADYYRAAGEDGVALLGPGVNFLNRLVVTMVKPYPAPTTEGEIYLTADINIARLASITDVKLGETGYIFIADNSGRIIYHPQAEHIGTVSPFFQNSVTQGFVDGFNGAEGQRYFLTTARSPITGWTVVSVAHADEFGAELRPIQRLTYLVIALILAGVVLLAAYLSHALSRPIKELQDLTQRAANNELSVHIEPYGNDEIAQLGHSFNKMIRRIQDLMAENVKEQELLRKLELESLDNQIKPHFIYNTLDLIIGHLESNKTEEATYLVEALGNFFRLSLSKGRETVPIASEVEHVRNYLFIQQLRHGGEYRYEIIIEDEAILNKFIPRLLLQPLVENAIYHGILRANREGTITVRGRQEGEKIIFEVADDGMGIEPDKLRDINEVLRGIRPLNNEREYFGLRNVNKRAQLRFGPEYGVVLESTLGHGTKAILTIKALEGDGHV
ncbi:MAG: sensor histidine kinase, partial [Limnochordia bacterium]|jgi:two-component system sensor histidine kinase YesM|nr:sensor histidine kinase [Limnochordia bacterium]